MQVVDLNYMQTNRLTQIQIDEIIKHFYEFRSGVSHPTMKARFQIPIRFSMIYLTIYQTKKILVQGDIETKKRFWEITQNFWRQINCTAWYLQTPNTKREALIWGGDESGKGDVFGSIHLTLVRNTPKLNLLVKQFHLQDSKKMSDQRILFLAPKILGVLKAAKSCYWLKIVPGKLINKNLNAVLAQHYWELISQTNDQIPVVIDAFCSYQKLREYWGNRSPSGNKISVKEKGESFFNAIAVASIISRYHFLQELKNWENTFALVNAIPKGASRKAQNTAKVYLAQNPKMAKIIKINYIKG